MKILLKYKVAARIYVLLVVADCIYVHKSIKLENLIYGK